MLLAGDELGHTQRGNNNCYCQDNDLTWLDWEPSGPREAFREFVRRLTRLWREQPVLRRRTFFQGRPIRGAGVDDVAWFTPVGREMADADWEEPATALGVRLAGDLINEADERGEPVVGDTLFVALNAGGNGAAFTLPAAHPRHVWELVLDTADDDRRPEVFEGGHRCPVAGRSVAVFRTRPRAGREPDVTPLQAEALRKAAAATRPHPHPVDPP
jgi:glycogen operon protein